MISIIIPVYNQAEKLDQCLGSISRQSYQNYEIIVVDDGSKDNIGPVIRKNKSHFGIKFEFIDQMHQGANAARNKGAAKAKGELLLFCDADIITGPDMLRIMREALQNCPEASYAYSSHKFGHKTFRLWPFDAEKLKQMPYIHTTSLLKMEHFPGFDENITKLQDWDMWLTMLEQGHTGVWINGVLYKIQPGGTMSHWMPSITYKLCPFLSKVRKYKKAVDVVKKKHGLL